MYDKRMLKLATLFVLIFGTKSSGDENENTAGTSKSPKLFYFKHFYNPFMKGHQFTELGNQLVKKKKYREAIMFYTKAIKRKPSKASYYGLRGVCYLELGDWNAAFSDFEIAVSTAAKNGTEESLVNILSDDKFIRLGMRLFGQFKLKEALWCYTEAINRKPDEASYYRIRGFCYSRSRDWGKAISDFENGLRLNPDDKLCKARLAETLFESGRIKDKSTVVTTQELVPAEP